MTIALVGSMTNIPGSSSGGTSAGFDTTGANCTVVCLGQIGTAGGALGSISDSKGNTYTGATLYEGNHGRSRVYYVTSPTVGSGHTFTVSGASMEGCGVAIALSGVHATPLDQQSGAAPTGGATTLQPAASITPSEDNEILIAIAAHWDNSTSVDAPFSSHTLNSNFTPGSVTGCFASYEIQTTATARRPTFSSGASAVKSCAIASFKAAGGAATTVARLVNGGLLHGGTTIGGRLVRQAA